MPPTDYKKYYIEHKEVIYERSKNRYLEHKEKYLELQKSRYYNKRDEISKKKKVKVTCECGSSFRKYKRTRHNRTKKHLKYLQSLALANGLILVRDIDNTE